MFTYVDFFGSRDLPPRLRAVLALLAELSSPPWKFDVLWEAWPELGLAPDDFPMVAQRLLKDTPADLIPYAACVFDDLTTYWDVVGRPGPPYPHDRAAYRNAYLAVRPMLFRASAADPPALGTPDEDALLLRLAMVSVLAGPGGVEPAARVLDEAAERYAARGKADGVAVARQNADILRHLANTGVPQQGPGTFAVQALKLMFEPEERAVSYEFAMQWGQFYSGRLMDTLRVKGDGALPGESPSDTAARGEFRAVLSRMETLSWLAGQRPGAGPAIIALALLRHGGRELPPSAALYPPDWIARCADDLAWLLGHYATTTDLQYDDVRHLEAVLAAARTPDTEPVHDEPEPPDAPPEASAIDLDPDEARATVMDLNRRGMELNHLGDLNGAVKLGEQAAAIAEAVLGADTPHYASSLNTVATALELANELEPAHDLFEQAARVMAAVFGEDSAEHASAMNNLANVEMRLGRLERAAELFRRAIDIGAREYGAESPQIVASISNLAHLCFKMGDLDAAEELLERGLRIRRTALGDRHPEVTASLGHLAGLYLETGRAEAAAGLFEEIVSIAAESVGEQHPFTIGHLEMLGNLQSRLARYDDAVVTYRRLLNAIIRTSDEEDRRYLAVLAELGWAALHGGRFETVQEAVREASGLLSRLDGAGTPEFAGLLRLQGHLDLKQGRFETAATAFERAHEMDVAAGADAHDVGIDLLGLGDARRAASDYSGAEDALRTALIMLDGAADVSASVRATAHSNLAELYRAMGRLDEAEPLYRSALELAGQAWPDGHPDRAAILNNYALLHLQRGSFRAALPPIEQAVDDLRRAVGTDHPTYAASVANLGDLRRQLGDYNEAEALLTEALEIRRRTLGHGHTDVALSLDALAALHADRGRLDLAVPLAQEALEVYRITFGDQHPEVAASLRSTAAKYLRSGLSGLAAALLAQAEPMLHAALTRDKPHPQWAGVLLLWAEIFLSAGNTGAAEPLVRQAVGIQEAALGDDHPQLIDGLWLLACLHAIAGRRDEAFAAATRVSAITDRIVGEVFATTSEEQRLAFTATIGRDVDLTLSLALRFGGAPAAADLVLRRKAITAEILGRQRDTAAPELAELRELRARIARLALAGPGTGDVEEHRRQLAEWQRLRTEREAALARTMPDTGPRPWPAHGAVAAALPPDSALVEFVRFTKPSFDMTFEGRYAAVVITRDTAPALLDLGTAAEVDGLIVAFRRTVAVSPRDRADAGDDNGHGLREMVLDPVLAAAGTSRVLIAPDGELHTLPFGALPGAPRTISYLGCGRDLLAPPAVGDAGPAMVVADPAYNLSVPQETAKPTGRQSRDMDRSMRFWRLRGTREEGERIAELLGVRPLLGEDACDATVKAARSPRILHLATHGFFLADEERVPHQAATEWGRLDSARLENPLLRSGLALAGANIWLHGGNTPPAAEDGLLTAEDLTGMDLSGTQLMVLSACETGLGEIHTGEGVFGLQRAATLAGARRLVMSLWKVPDPQTRTLMVTMYERLIAGASVPDALAHAQEQVRRSNPDPYYWAGFVATGDPAPLDL